MSDSSGYPLGYTGDEARRLADQATLFEDITADFLQRSGIASGMQILDLGCGVGDVSFLASHMVGTNGAILGIDRSASSVETARRRATAIGVRNVRFETAELDTFDTAQTFDAVIGRFVLLYQPDPSAILRRFTDFLRPDGIIAFQECDLEASSHLPASELFTRVFRWALAAFKASGAEVNMGSRLLSVFLSAGLPQPSMIAAQRVDSGPDSQIYALIAETVRSVLPLLERTGIATAEEVSIDTLAERLRNDAITNECVIFGRRMVGAWSRLSIQTNRNSP